MKFDKSELSDILNHFGLTFREVTDFHDTSHGPDDERLNYILDDRYVLKINSPCAMWENRLQEITRLIDRYHSIGVYCPALIPTTSGTLSCNWKTEDKEYICFVEEFAKYPLCEMDADMDRKEIIEHLGVLAARYSGVDLSETRSMWSIIDLAPLDTDMDEKQENTNLLVKALSNAGYPDLAQKVNHFNNVLRSKIMSVFHELPRCVFQGDLNNSNILHDRMHFVGLIDFNLSGTDVNINVFLNETQWFPEEDEFEQMTVSEIVEKIDKEQQALLSVIFRHYTLNEAEHYAFPCYKGIIDLFQYPNVCMMIQLLKEDTHRGKCMELIQTLVNRISL